MSVHDRLVVIIDLEVRDSSYRISLRDLSQRRFDSLPWELTELLKGAYNGLGFSKDAQHRNTRGLSRMCGHQYSFRVAFE
jgi:hypothetical protein